jgi:hypothetical protein
MRQTCAAPMIRGVVVEDSFYIECTLPAGLTIADYRRLRPRRSSLWTIAIRVLRRASV